MDKTPGKAQEITPGKAIKTTSSSWKTNFYYIQLSWFLCNGDIISIDFWFEIIRAVILIKKNKNYQKIFDKKITPQYNTNDFFDTSQVN